MPIITLFFDVTANHGWNLVAIANYLLMILLVVLAIFERKERT